jgi:polyhydroxyalkanoate synthase
MGDTVKNNTVKRNTVKIHETTKKSTDSDLQKIFSESNEQPHSDNDFFNDFMNSAADTGQNINKIMSLSQKLTSELFFSGMGRSDKTVFDPLNAMQSWFDTISGMMNNPEKIIESQMNLWEQYTKLCAYSLAKMGGDAVSPLIKPEHNDRRFRSEAWNDTFFDFIKQCYLLVGNSVLDTVEKTGNDMDERSRQRALFFTKQYIDALSPSNFLMTNPEALQETFKTGGANLVKGLENLVRDFEQGQGRLHITQTDKTAFKIGKNLATSAGQVVFRNELIELIHYNPQSDMVYAQPLSLIHI